MTAASARGGWRTGVVALLLATPALADGPYTNNWPTYMDTAAEHWPTASQYDALVEALTTCHLAITERSVAAGLGTNTAPQSVGTRWPYQDVDRFKLAMADVTPRYVDDRQYATFQSTSSFPRLVLTQVLNRVSLAQDFVSVTPKRCLAETVAPGFPADHGVPALDRAVAELKWTSRGFYYSDQADAATDIRSRQGSGVRFAYVAGDPFGDAVADAREQYTTRGWENNTGGSGCFYSFVRNVAPAGGANWNHWVNTARAQSTPQCSQIIVPDGCQFDWEAYLLPGQADNPCAANTDGYTGWVQNQLKSWDTGGPTAATVVQAKHIGGTDETFPMDVAPVYNSPAQTNYNVEVYCLEFEWLLKWRFQHGN